MHKSTRTALQLKQRERERLVAEMENELGFAADHPEDVEVVHSSAMAIVSNLKNRKPGWTSERVTIAFIRAACDAHRKTNCLSEVLFREALNRASEMDEAFRQSGTADGAFWGLPSSFKDTFNILGVDSSVGCSTHCFQAIEEKENEAAIVRIFRQAGGIPFCKTNVPQTLLAFECSNPIFGATSNPISSSRTCGGSSGGEAALVALCGTPLGWGSDIGGSLRIPAAYSGCCSLKPAVGRWPISGSRQTVHGFDGIRGVVGPMARTVDELTFASHTILDLVGIELAKHRLASDALIPLPWREPSLPKRLRIGYWTDDNVITTSPACRRAVVETIAALKKIGHEVIEFNPPNVREALKVFVALSSAEGYQQLLSNLGPDPMEPSMRLVTLGASMPRFFHSFITWAVQYIIGDDAFADIMSISRPKSVSEYWYWTARRDAYRSAFRKTAWEDNAFDFLICPVQAVPALEHGRTKLLSPLCIATVLFNVVDSTAGVLPVTRVDADLDVLPPDFSMCDGGSWMLEKRIYGTDDPAYDSKKMHGLPIGVQVVGREWEEEKVLAMMKLIEQVL